MDRSVVHIAAFSTPHSGGFISSIKALGAHLQNNGYRLALVFPDAARKTQWVREFENNGYRVYFLPPVETLFALVCRINQIIKAERADIIHTHFSNYNFSSGLVSVWLNLLKRPPKTFWHFHSDWRVKITLKRRVKDLILYNILGRFVYGISVSNHIKDIVVSRGMPRERMYYVPNGFDIERVTSSQSDSNALRHEFGIPEGKKVFLSFGWEPVTKGIDILLKAFEDLAKHRNNVVLLLVGTEKMRQFVDEWICGAAREWLILSQPREAVAEFYRISDVFVSASRSEGFPYSVAEAMAAKLPIVSSDIPGMDWAKNVDGVVFFENCNENSLARAMAQTLEWSEGERTAKILANNKFVSENYSLEKWSSNILAVYNSIHVSHT